MTVQRETIQRCLLIDWGDTLMRNFPDYTGPMVSWPQVEIIPGVRETLVKLFPTWRLAVATNAEDSQVSEIQAALQRVEISQFFDAIYCFRKIGAKKPSAAYIAYILNDLQLPVSQVVMVGDDQETDIVGANRQGLRAVWLNERSNESLSGPLIYTIHRFHELHKALDFFGIAA